jgi:hypothetical protein
MSSSLHVDVMQLRLVISDFSGSYRLSRNVSISLRGMTLQKSKAFIYNAAEAEDH